MSEITSVPSLAETSNEDDEPSALTTASLEERRSQFSSFMASVSEFWLQQENKDSSNPKETTSFTRTTASEEPTTILPESNLNLPNRHFHIVTTATLPWFTGTAVNPLLRAAYLHRRTQQINQDKQQWVTLIIPWLDLPEDQQETLGRVFASPDEQEAYIRDWLRIDMPDVASELRILFYEARYHSGLGSIFAMGDLLQMIQRTGLTMDVCIVEEPEHVNWFRAAGDGWTMKYKFVVGVLHTNYKEYAIANGGFSGLWTAHAISMVSSAMVRAYCHKVIKLSAALHDYAPEKEVICNVHGVRSEFLKEGQRRATERSLSCKEDTKTPYFIGKLLWTKGLDILLKLEVYHKQLTGDYFPIDIYGKGPEQLAIQKAFQGGNSQPKNSNESIIGRTVDIVPKDDSSEKESDSDHSSAAPSKVSSKAPSLLSAFRGSVSSLESMSHAREPIPSQFPGRVDHLALGRYKIFVNPSLSEVLCTTTAEALAMGKFVIIPIHPSNEFFLSFPNCLGYRNQFEFVANLHWAQTNEPQPLTPELEEKLTWEAATDRFIEASAITVQEAQRRKESGQTKLDERIAWFHNELGKGRRGDMIRKMLGGGPVSAQSKYLTEMQNHRQEADVERASDSGDDSESLTSRDHGDSSDDNDIEDDGLSASSKFRQSGFSDVIRATVKSFSKTKV